MSFRGNSALTCSGFAAGKLGFAAALVALAWLALHIADPELAFAASKAYWKGEETDPFAGGIIRRAYCDIAYFAEGNFGGLLAAAAGVMGLAFAAFGNLERMGSFVVVAVGTTTLTAGVSLYFGTFGCEGPYSPRTARTGEGLTADDVISRSAINIALGRETEGSAALNPDLPDSSLPPSEQEETDESDPFDF